MLPSPTNTSKLLLSIAGASAQAWAAAPCSGQTPSSRERDLGCHRPRATAANADGVTIFRTPRA